ncbi:hypothetical protein F4553_000363 [Allocatelliglobosispora scoriae]|uniref:SMI1/KNR4 family protein n=1 Tax=Allocatelliglobosispora scoriae TaxID=643052 RepID=A0A841BFB7_9ACTN|nr:SMI1/KNR4 family protein [Allocatelliglobosispora scoriae]MBB5866984.1 hypothetical protein [Allocatelliglobosispora scoriae]
MTVTAEDRELPAALTEAHAAPFRYREDGGVDFEPYDEFMTAAETGDWWRAWTGNPELDGAEFRCFGMDGTGGQAAFWLVRAGAPVERQPVVFLGSEGETGVVARDLDDYLWLLADGFGPYEAVAYPSRAAEPDERLTGIASRYAPHARRSGHEVIAAARAEFPEFEQTIEGVCR